MEIYILNAKRTAIGSFLGSLSSQTAIDLGTHVLKGLLEQTHIQPKDIQEVTIGCVLTAGLGQAPARQIALRSGIPNKVDTTTINKVCGSGLKSIMMLSDHIKLGYVDCGIAGGVESMTNAPFFHKKARTGNKYGNITMYDHIIMDGLEDAYEHKSMGLIGDEITYKYNISREEQDKFAIRSILQSQESTKSGFFKQEIIPVNISGTIVSEDEYPNKLNIEKIPKLKPIFRPNGTITAATSSSLSDGAAVVCLASSHYVKTNNFRPMAKIIAYSSYGHEPENFATTPSDSIKKVLHEAKWTVEDVDLFEINEAFAFVPIIAMQNLNIPLEKINIRGGSVSLGHPLGATGCRLLVTLLHTLEQKSLKRGIVSLCIGGGEGVSMAIEMVSTVL